MADTDLIYLTDLTNTVWQFNDTISSGLHLGSSASLYHLTGSLKSGSYSLTLPYTHSSYTYEYIGVWGSDYTGEGNSNGRNVFQCGLYSSGSYSGYFITYCNKGIFNATESGWRYFYYNGSSTFSYAGKSTISAPVLTITGGSSVKNKALIVWLLANATLISGGKTSTTIAYNGTTFTPFEVGQTATLKCANKKALSDISVTFGDEGYISYKGFTTEIESGKTANLLCGGKKIPNEVIVGVVKPTLSTLPAGTWVFNDTVSLAVFNPAFRFTSVINSKTTSMVGMKISSSSISYERGSGGGSYSCYSSSDGWKISTAKTIKLSTDQTVTKEFYDWFTANATKQ